MREVDNPKLRKIMGPARHGIVAGISILGIVGAVLQIVAVDNFDMAQFNTAKALRRPLHGRLSMGHVGPSRPAVHVQPHWSA